MHRSVVFTRTAARAMSRMPRRTEELIRETLRQLAAEPGSLANNVRALRGSDRFRLRVGDLRVLYTLEPGRIIVHDAGPRGSIYS